MLEFYLVKGQFLKMPVHWGIILKFLDFITTRTRKFHFNEKMIPNAFLAKIHLTLWLRAFHWFNRYSIAYFASPYFIENFSTLAYFGRIKGNWNTWRLEIVDDLVDLILVNLEHFWMKYKIITISNYKFWFTILFCFNFNCFII